MNPTTHTVPPEAAGQRLDAWLATQLENVSRARVQLLLSESKVLVNGAAPKPSLKLRGGESIEILSEPTPPPLRATPEDIPLDIVYEDADLSVINKPAGMMVHAGAGATDDVRNRGTLVNALLNHYRQLSTTGGPLRPGIVHRLDKQTSGLIIVARNDAAHLKLGEMFSRRQVHKTYLALVHGHVKADRGTISAAIARDAIRRTRMTTRRESLEAGARTAISHYAVIERITSRFGAFTLVSVRIETGRTHQIRVHLSSIGHPVARRHPLRSTRSHRRPRHHAPKEIRPRSRDHLARPQLPPRRRAPLRPPPHRQAPRSESSAARRTHSFPVPPQSRTVIAGPLHYR